jgi:hypothetical protein
MAGFLHFREELPGFSAHRAVDINVLKAAADKKRQRKEANKNVCKRFYQRRL